MDQFSPCLLSGPIVEYEIILHKLITTQILTFLSHICLQLHTPLKAESRSRVDSLLNVQLGCYERLCLSLSKSVKVGP